LSNTVMRALERSPEQRWQTARDFAIELERNVALAAPHVVGDWVAQHAGEALQDRRRRVEAVERASVDLGHVGPSATAAASAELVGPTSARALAAAAAAEPVDPAASSSATSRSSNLTISNSAAAIPSTFRQIVVSLLFGATAVGIIGGIWYWQQHGFEEPDAGPSAATLPGPGESGVSREPSRRATPPADHGAVPPMVEIDSLPESTDGADAGILPGAWAGADPGRTNGQIRRRASRRPNHTARASSVAPAKGVRPALPATPDPAAQNSECSPPWYIDAKGIQRLKPKCL
jgi:serine/threonine-protein kinase